jgi:hypothetical protein
MFLANPSPFLVLMDAQIGRAPDQVKPGVVAPNLIFGYVSGLRALPNVD